MFTQALTNKSEFYSHGHLQERRWFLSQSWSNASKSAAPSCHSSIPQAINGWANASFKNWMQHLFLPEPPSDPVVVMSEVQIVGRKWHRGDSHVQMLCMQHNVVGLDLQPYATSTAIPTGSKCSWRCCLLALSCMTPLRM